MYKIKGMLFESIKQSLDVHILYIKSWQNLVLRTVIIHKLNMNKDIIISEITTILINNSEVNTLHPVISLNRDVRVYQSLVATYVIALTHEAPTNFGII